MIPYKFESTLDFSEERKDDSAQRNNTHCETKQRQFSLATLMFITAGFAVSLAVLPYPYVAYSVMLGFFFIAAILSRFGPQDARVFWRWFSFSGWLSAIFGTPMIDTFQLTTFGKATVVWLNNNHPGPVNWSAEEYLLFCNSLIAMIIATSGGLLISTLSRRLNYVAPPSQR